MLHTVCSRFRSVALLTAFLIAFSMLGASPLSAGDFTAAAPWDAGPDTGPGGPPAASPSKAHSGTWAGGLSSGFSGVKPGTYTVTLITGAKLHVDVYEDGTAAVAARGEDWDGSSFWTTETDNAFYFYPDNVSHLIPTALDPELFNISYLIAHGYHDEARDDIPVIITGPRSGGRGSGSATFTGTAGFPSAASRLPGFRESITFTSIPGAAGSFGKSSDLSALHRVLASPGETIAGGAIEKIWLDRQLTVSLEDSGPIVGAPAAREAGYDGEGITVAVLDTGVDPEHPDLVDRIVMMENFTDDPDAVDGHGHGTHVAGIVAGTGAASDGLRKGMAPGADLIIGKVLSDSGRGPTSGVIAGMEWAAARADIINMSLGSGATDGTDPVSLALNSLTEEHGVLFVVSSGNDGPGMYTVGSPGTADLALTVGNTDKNDGLANLSSRGPRVGDHAIKPDMTATGTEIASARAEGTALGPVVDDYYTRISGTSMAAPHVAGAAALLLQKRPDAGPAELKAMLSSTAAPNLDLTIYEQGGGRLDIGRALGAEIVPDKSALNIGYFPYPHDDAEPATAALTYANIGESDITLTLTVGAADEEGTPVHAGHVSLDAEELTVPAGGEATVEVTVDIPALDYGLYGGYLTAADADGAVIARTPVGFFKEAEVYDLTITGIARDGRPAAGNSSVDVMSLEERDSLNTTVRFTDGEAVLRVPAGRYAINSHLYTYDDADKIHELTFVARPEIEVFEDVAITLDARPATKLQIVTPELTEVEFLNVTYYQVDDLGGSMRRSITTNIVEDRFYTVPTGPEPENEYEFYTRHILSAPEFKMVITAPEELDLDANYMSGSPRIDGEFNYEIVSAGLGTPDDFDGLDVEGKAVLMERGEISFSDKARNAYEAGGAIAIIYNNEPGSFNGTVEADPTIPAFSLLQTEGLAIEDLLAGSAVHMVVVGAPVSPFQYDLVLPEPGGIHGELVYVPGENLPLASIDTGYHSDVTKEQAATRHFWRPYTNTGIGLTLRHTAPLRRTEYVAANDTRYRRTVNYEAPFTGRQEEATTMLTPGPMEMSWWKQAVRPGFIEGSPYMRGKPTLRSGNTLQVAIAETADANHDHWGERDTGVDTTEFRYYRDGSLIATDERGFEKLFPMVIGEAEYRLELDWSRNMNGWLTSKETKTAWTFTSEGSTGQGIVPLLVVEYDLPVDLTNRITQRVVNLNVRHQKGAPTSPIAGLEMEVSFDDGASWEAADVEPVAAGHFTASLPAPDGDPEYVSFRVAARDEDGSRIDQTIMRAAAWAVSEDVELTVSEPEEGTHTNDDTITVAGTAIDPSGGHVAVTVNGREAEADADGSFEKRILLPEDDGEFTITVAAAGENGGTATETRTVIVDRTPPVIDADSIDPAADVELEWGEEMAVSFTGEAGLKASYQLLVPGAGTGDDGLPGVTIEEVEAGVYKGVYTAPEGAAFTGAEIEIYAMDKAGNLTRVTAPGKVTVIPDESGEPDPVSPPTVIIHEPADGFLTNRDAVRVSGTATDDQDGQEIEEVTVNGRAVEVAHDGSFTTRVILWEGDNDITVSATNTAGETATEKVTVTADWTAPVLTGMRPGADITVGWGETVTFRFKSEADLTAAFQVVVDGSHGEWITRDIPVKGTPMRPVGSDLTGTIYEGTFTAPEGVSIENAIVQFNAADRAGNVTMVTAPGELTVVEGD